MRPIRSTPGLPLLGLPPRSRLGIHARVVGTLLLVLAITFAAATQLALHSTRNSATASLGEEAAAQTVVLSELAIAGHAQGDYRGLEAHVRAMVRERHLAHVSYAAADGYTLQQRATAASAERPEWFARLAGLSRPPVPHTVTANGVRYGTLIVQPSAHAYEDLLWQLGERLTLLLGGALAILVLLLHRLLKKDLGGLRQLRAAARRIESGDYAARIDLPPGSPPELGETAHAFNHMGAAVADLLGSLGEQQKALDSAACVTVCDLDGTITHVNDQFCILSGYTHDELIGQPYRIVDSAHHDAAFYDELWQTVAAGRIWRGELCNRGRDGRLFWTATTIVPLRDATGVPHKYLTIRFDITQRKTDEAAIREEKARWQITLQSINDAVIVTNLRNQVVYLNPSAEALLGIAHEDAVAVPLKNLARIEGAGEDGQACFLSSTPPTQGRTGSARLHTASGNALDISYSCAPLTGEGGNGAVYVLRDETERKKLLDDLREMAFHDTLTELPNRRAVEGRLARALRTANDEARQHAFCYIDLDHFKLVNDTCGHAIGDALLADIAQTMRAALPAQAYLGRLGGDEFGLILFDTPPDESVRICRQLVQRIRDFRFEHKGRRFTLGACAGVAPITPAATTAGELMVQADMACYRAKSEGSGRVLLYEADEVGFRRLEAEMGWAADFAQALEANQFLPYRQLIQPARPGAQPHYEVLIRWQRNGTVEGPAKLLPALERYGQAPTLDRWMLEAVIAHLAAHPDDEAVYFINLSGKTVADETFLGTVCHLLDHYGVAGERLGFEVTETAAVVNLTDAQRLIEGLRQRGCRFALDDFGRDASSFFYLKHLPADFLKIDGAFVRGMLDDNRDQAIVRSIAKLASDFGMHSIAEQVENAAMADLLMDMGVDYLQGYHVHRPEAFPHWEPVRVSAGSRPGDGPRPPLLTRVK
ncbi:MAG: EAL domain-containing protein [Gammaproteobacteria bacterium]